MYTSTADCQLYINGTLKLYINGVLNATVNATHAGFADHGHLFIGGIYPHTDTVNFWLNGRVDDIRIWNRSLSAQQILALYQNRSDIIVAQETLKFENWSACVTPNDNSNASADGSTVCSENLTILNEAPSIALVNPPNGTVNDSRSHIFRATVLDNETLFNATLYHNNTGTWHANQTISLNGTSNTTNFSVTRITQNTFIWNVQACDIDYVCRQATNNFTLSVNNVTVCGNNVIEGSEQCDNV